MSIDLEQLRRDMEAGTDGPWTYEPGYKESIVGPNGEVIIHDEYGLSCECDLVRIARLPDLERAYLELREAADALADAVEKMTSRPASPATGGRLILEVDVRHTVVQAAAYRKATQ